ncbi:MAG: hypothetical protein K5745_00160, partial [Saccharofermentans sp.]|nr:hypothetical protein [Saccharofermentans sp.]
MENNGKQERAVYEQPGILDPDRNVPYNKDTDLTIVTHYNNDSEVYPDTRTSFTDTSANAMQPIEDYALLRGEVKPKVRGSSSGVKITPNII